MKKSTPLTLLAISLTALIFFGLYHQHQSVSKTAHENGFKLSKDVIDLSPFLNDGNGRLNITYESEFINGDVETPFIEGGRLYGVSKEARKNCFPSKKLKFPFLAIRSKEKVDIQGRSYTSYLELKGQKLFIDKKVLFDESGYAYVSFSDLQSKMAEACPDYFTRGWKATEDPQPPEQPEDFRESPASIP